MKKSFYYRSDAPDHIGRLYDTILSERPQLANMGLLTQASKFVVNSLIDMGHTHSENSIVQQAHQIATSLRSSYIAEWLPQSEFNEITYPTYDPSQGHIVPRDNCVVSAYGPPKTTRDMQRILNVYLDTFIDVHQCYVKRLAMQDEDDTIDLNRLPTLINWLNIQCTWLAKFGANQQNWDPKQSKLFLLTKDIGRHGQSYTANRVIFETLIQAQQEMVEMLLRHHGRTIINYNDNTTPDHRFISSFIGNEVIEIGRSGMNKITMERTAPTRYVVCLSNTRIEYNINPFNI